MNDQKSHPLAISGATGLSERVLALYKKKGMPVATAAASIAWITQNKRVKIDSPRPTGNADAPEVKPSGYMDARVARERAEAELAQIKALEARGTLVSREAVRSELARRLSGLREALLQIPSRLEAVLAAEEDPGKIHQLLEDEIYAALAGVSEVA
jgi:phage terminase Nu1 subunit (DNA packaging protein)